MHPIIKLENITKDFFLENGEKVEVLKGIDLEIHKGEFVALMGESGSGKSTALNIISCLFHPTSGKYFLDGDEMEDLEDDEVLSFIRNKKMGFVFQQFHLIPNYSAIENVSIPGIYARTEKEERLKKANELLIKLGLKKKLHSKPGSLSGGEQQRVAIARALMNNTEVLLADEPTGSLDSKTSTEIMELLKTLNEEGVTIIMVTHSEETAKYADKILFLTDGSIKK